MLNPSKEASEIPLSVINPVTYFAGVTSKPKFIALLLVGYIKTILISLFAMVIGAFLVLSNSYSAVFIFIICVFDVIGFIVQVLFFSIIGSVIMSWVSPNSDNLFFRLVNEFSDAILNPIRKFIPAMGGLDFTPIFGLLLFNFLSSFVGNGFIVWQLALR